jgi:hypothetical protein
MEKEIKKALDDLKDLVGNIDQNGCPVRGSVLHEKARNAIETIEKYFSPPQSQSFPWHGFR